MILALDVQYDQNTARVAGVWFDRWDATVPVGTTTLTVMNIEPYVSGEFYRRELPCLKALISSLDWTPEVIVVDGYVWLADGKSGLGHYLYQDVQVPVVGVAKTSFSNAPHLETQRGSNGNGGFAKPLYVTTVQMDADEAVEAINSMAGVNRIPTLLKLVDSLARGRDL